MVARLVEARSAARRDDVVIDEGVNLVVHWDKLQQSGMLVQLRVEVEHAYAEALSRGDLNAALNACLGALRLIWDPADRWYVELSSRQISDPRDRGLDDHTACRLPS